VKRNKELEFLLRRATDGSCNREYWNTPGKCSNNKPSKCPIYKYMVKLGHCNPTVAREPARKVLEKKYPVEYLELILKEDIK
jgi:hypothetical protein